MFYTEFSLFCIVINDEYLRVRKKVFVLYERGEMLD